ncbi:hypothetical protein ABZ784_28880 [Streptomyces tendae]|uniref:hypothetical protein n=1 Tax=Streptomyces tendae TaxID=1932 RepID=UPI00340B52A3
MSDETDEKASGRRFVVRELDPRCFVVDDTATTLSYDMRFTRQVAQEAADRRNRRNAV